MKLHPLFSVLIIWMSLCGAFSKPITTAVSTNATTTAIGYNCIDVTHGRWDWSTKPDKNGPVVKPPTLQTDIKFYKLKQDDEIDASPLYFDRCFVNPGKTLPETNSKWDWKNPQYVSEKLTKAALKILDVVYWNWYFNKYGLPVEKCGAMMSRTVAIAHTNNKDLYLAGNLDEGFQLKDNKDKIIQILMKDLFEGGIGIRNIWVINDEISTFGGKGKSWSHAEMQIAKYALEKNLVIENLGVSKTPCCACNTVLRKAVIRENNIDQEVKAPTGKENNDPYHKMFAKSVNVASARGTGQETIGTEPFWKGGDQFQRFQNGFVNWNYWHHPSSVDFINVEAKLIFPQ